MNNENVLNNINSIIQSYCMFPVQLLCERYIMTILHFTYLCALWIYFVFKMLFICFKNNIQFLQKFNVLSLLTSYYNHNLQGHFSPEIPRDSRAIENRIQTKIKKYHVHSSVMKYLQSLVEIWRYAEQ